MKKIIFLSTFLFLISVLNASEVHEASERIRKELNACVTAGQATQAQLECYSHFSDSLDVALNWVYGSINSKLGDGNKKSLRESQRAWIQFRDKEIATSKSIYSLVPGTIKKQYIAGTVYSITENRLKELEDYLSVLIQDVGK